jgi:hypothetical protein
MRKSRLVFNELFSMCVAAGKDHGSHSETGSGRLQHLQNNCDTKKLNRTQPGGTIYKGTGATVLSRIC